LRFEDREITSIGKLLDYLKKDKQKVKTPLWFRGHARKSWTLFPSIFRPENKKEEIEYMKKFKQDALLIVEPIPRESYEWLFVMRHNHIPTRLLDWTESPLIALYFALSFEEKFKNTQTSMLWVLSPNDLNKNVDLMQGDSALPTFQETKNVMETYTTEKYYDVGSLGQQNPIAFLAPRNTERMQAQQSVFTIHHRIKKPIEKLGDGKHVWRYSIPKSAKEKLRKELRLLRINKFQLFPELPVIYDKIKEEEKWQE